MGRASNTVTVFVTVGPVIVGGVPDSTWAMVALAGDAVLNAQKIAMLDQSTLIMVSVEHAPEGAVAVGAGRCRKCGSL